MPHAPFVFDELGKKYISSDSITDKQKYLGQLKYTNSLTLETLKYIFKNSKTKPIIIIQGDHGFRTLVDGTQIEKSLVAHSVFYAIYTPNGLIVPSIINPSTTFRKIVAGINHE